MKPEEPLSMASFDEPRAAADQKSQPEERQRSRCVDGIAGSGANEKGGGAGKHDGGGPWVAPGAKRSRAVRLSPTQHDQRETADEIIGGQKECHHCHQPLKRSGRNERKS